MFSEYALRSELRGHEEDVRGLAFQDAEIVYTSSRDKTIRAWKAAGKSFNAESVLVGHTNYVGPLAWIPAGMAADYPLGAVVSGSRDTTVIVWDPESAHPLHTLTGHGYQVTAVGYTSNGTIISTSLDKTTKVWKDGKCLRTLEGHQGPVLSLIVLSDDEILTGSGDTTIKRWNITRGSCTQTITGHTDTVRSMALLPNIGFVSGSHDHTIKVWTIEGMVLAELLGHTAIIYCVAATADGIIASGSEDNTVRLWRASGECLQTIDHPGCVWDVSFLPDSTLLSACSDSVARAWTTSPDMQADAEEVAGLEAAVTAFKAGSKGGEDGGAGPALPDGLKLEEPAALLQPGQKDGETKIVRENGGAVAYGWSAARFEWEKIGDVVSGPGEAGPAKKTWGGREWDYVFDVDVEDGAPPRKLAGDLHENPYIVADRFLEQEELPPYFKEQVVQFILQNTSGMQKPAQVPDNMPITGGFCDPFTGGASTSSDPPPPRPAAPPAASLPTGITGGFVDPFTGGSSSGPSTSSAPAQGVHIPASQYLLFDSAPKSIDPLLRKLKEFSSALAADASTSGLVLCDSEGPQLDSLAAKAAAGGKGISSADVALLQRLLSWPADKLFPVLDLARLAILDPSAAKQLGTAAGDFDSLNPGTIAVALHTAAAAASEAAAHQTALRLACNLFKHDALRGWAGIQRGPLLDRFAQCAASPNKAVRGALSALLQNLALLLTTARGGDAEGTMQVLSALVELLGGDNIGAEDPETIYRCLVAVGTLAKADGSTKDLARDLGLADICQQISRSASGKVQQVADEVMAVLH